MQSIMNIQKMEQNIKLQLNKSPQSKHSCNPHQDQELEVHQYLEKLPCCCLSRRYVLLRIKENTILTIMESVIPPPMSTTSF